MCRKYFILILGISFFINDAYSQSESFTSKNYSMREGLSNSDVNCITQDKFGFIWLGTANGLNRFDGYEFKHYYQELQPGSLPSNDINSLYTDEEGQLWVGTTKGLCRYNYEKDYFISELLEDSSSLGLFNIFSIQEDDEGKLWLAAYRMGIIIYNPENGLYKRLQNDPSNPSSINSNTVFSIFRDSKNHMWITTYDAGAGLYNRPENSFTRFQHNPADPNSLLGNNVHAMTEDSRGYLWFACNYAGVSSIHLQSLHIGIFTNYFNQQNLSNSLQNNHARTIIADRNGGVWIGMSNRTIDYLYNGTFTHLQLGINNHNSSIEEKANTLFIDNQQNIWIANSYSGIHILYPKISAFSHYRTNPDRKYSLSNDKIWGFAEDKDGFIWIATNGGGLNRFDPKSGQVISYSTDNSSISSDQLMCVFVDSSDDIWMGSWSKGLIRFSHVSKKFDSYTTENSAISNNNIFDIDEDSEGNLWIATQNGLNKFDKAANTFESYTPENSDLIFSQMEVVQVDKLDNIIIGNVQGLIIFNPGTGIFKTYSRQSGTETFLSDDFVTTILEVDSTHLWIGTKRGLNLLNRKTDEVTSYYMQDGLPSDIIYGLETDNFGFLWISTDRGLVRTDMALNVFDNYGIDDGMQDYIFIKKSHLKSSTGKLYFGGINGFNMIDPEKISTHKHSAPLVFSELLISNKPVRPGDHFGILSAQLPSTDSIRLTHKHPNFSVKFAALDYKNADNILYTYKLEGYDTDWNFIGKQRMATYTNLDPGKYTLKVRNHISSENSNKNTLQLFIQIMPPWWETTAFRIILFITISGLILGIYRLRLSDLKKQRLELIKQVDRRTNELRASNKQLVLKHEQLTEVNFQLEETNSEVLAQRDELEKHRNHLESLVAERTSELEKAKHKAEESDRLKSAFLANLSHEIRTPMNAIVGFSSMLDAPDLTENERTRYIEMVNSNCDALTILINDIIDISLIESNQLVLKKSTFHADAIFEELLTYYESIRNKDIALEFENSNTGQELLLENDPVRFKQILSNLLSNAIKYTSRGSIKFGYNIKDDKVEFYVQDSGVGIKESDAKKIFDHFHKLDSRDETLYRGVGIGLSICRHLAQLMGGEIWVKSAVDKGSTFFFTLPYLKQSGKSDQYKHTNTKEILDLSSYTILIAEDDTTNYILLKKILKATKAEILWAKDGEEAVELSTKWSEPENLIILMDIKMPRMNGFEALRVIRQKHKTVPIIAVTAYAQENDRMEILKNNFSGYVTKPILRPFLMKVIRENIEKRSRP